jgi:hypothetical protein
MTEPSDPRRFGYRGITGGGTSYLPLRLGAILAVALLVVFLSSDHRAGSNVSQNTSTSTIPQTPNQPPNPGPPK